MSHSLLLCRGTISAPKNYSITREWCGMAGGRAYRCLSPQWALCLVQLQGARSRVRRRVWRVLWEQLSRSKVSNLLGNGGRPRVETGARSGYRRSVQYSHTTRIAAPGLVDGRQQSVPHRSSCVGTMVMDNRWFIERGWMLYRGRSRESRTRGGARRVPGT